MYPAGYMGNLTGKTEKSGTVGAFDKAGNVDTICILLRDVDPTAEKLYRSDLRKSCIVRTQSCIVQTILYSLLVLLYRLGSQQIH